MRIDARCWPTTFTLDALGRTVGRQYIDGTRATFTFDAAGEQTTMQDVTGVTTYLRDNAVRQIGVVNGAGKALTFTLDLVATGWGWWIATPVGRVLPGCQASNESCGVSRRSGHEIAAHLRKLGLRDYAALCPRRLVCRLTSANLSGSRRL
ncbi:MAG TPA: hypothetical protein VFJ58_26530 [Armatimonadota bacterium]|nr:hypothetical protein [Armatimonadota bacterium]